MRTYQVKQNKLSRYYDLALSLLEKFTSYTMEPTPQKHNQHADAMVCVSSLISIKDPVVDLNFTIHNLSSPTITNNSSDIAC